MKTFKDIAHLYLGCKCMEAIIVPGQEPKFEEGVFDIRSYYNLQNNLSVVKPVLRTVFDLQQGELDFDGLIDGYEITKTKYNMKFSSLEEYGFELTIYSNGSMDCLCKDNGEYYPYNGGEMFTQLLKLRIDLFGMIKSGEALYLGHSVDIDETGKLKLISHEQEKK